MNFALKILYRFYRVLTWLRFRAGRRLTVGGWTVLIALLAAGFMGVDTDTTVAYQAFTPLLFLLLISLAFSLTFRGRFSASRVLPRFGTAGQPFVYSIFLRNQGRRMETDLTLRENVGDSRPSFADWKTMQLADQRRRRSFRISEGGRPNPFTPAAIKSTPVPVVRSGEEVEIRAEFRPLRRGVIRLRGLSIARPDPFGLCRAFCNVPAPQSVLILPRRYLLPPIALPGIMKYQQGGVALASSVGQSDEFVSLRDYRRGDPLRHIHWRSWAKTGKPIVKEFEDEFFVRHALVLDTFTKDPRSDAFEEAVSVAASFASAIELQETLLDLLFIGTEAYCFTAGRGLAHADQMLEILASVKPCSDKSFATLEHLVLDHAAAVSSCICVLLDWDERRREFVRELQSMDVPLLVLVITEPGNSKTIDPGPMQHQQERFHVLQAGRIQEGLTDLVL